jgi:hypothetical protein
VLEWFGPSELDSASGLFLSFTLALAAEAASAVGDKDRVALLYRRLQPHAHENIMVSWGAGCLGSAAHYLGILAAALDDFETANRHLKRRFRQTGACECPVWLPARSAAMAKPCCEAERAVLTLPMNCWRRRSRHSEGSA